MASTGHKENKNSIRDAAHIWKVGEKWSYICVQLDTIHKIWTAYSNIYEYSPQGFFVSNTFKGGRGKSLDLISISTYSWLFQLYVMYYENSMRFLV